jgi:hypothetical protein
MKNDTTSTLSAFGIEKSFEFLMITSSRRSRDSFRNEAEGKHMAPSWRAVHTQMLERRGQKNEQERIDQ